MAKKREEPKSEHIIAVRLNPEKYAVLLRIWANRILEDPNAQVDGRTGAGKVIQDMVDDFLQRRAAEMGLTLGGDASEG